MKCSANSLCPCESGKKYKRCCRAKDDGMRQLFENIVSGQIPFTAQIISKSGEASSMEVSHASITQNSRTTVLLDEKVTLATNSTHGDKTSSSVASISIPADGSSPGAIRTTGNASVSNSTQFQAIALAGGVKKLKATSDSGLFVVALIGLQRETQIQYFDFLFGVRGQSEEVDESGKKQRPHINLYPDGNGKFIRLSGHNCEIEVAMQYHVGDHRVLPQQLRIKSTELGETIEVTFSTESSERVVLDTIRFTPHETLTGGSTRKPTWAMSVPSSLRLPTPANQWALGHT